jgi:hypothetical protein
VPGLAVEDVQRALKQHAAEAFRAMGHLWQLVPGAVRVERRRLSHGRLVRGGNQPYSWVWDEKKPAPGPPAPSSRVVYPVGSAAKSAELRQSQVRGPWLGLQASYSVQWSTDKRCCQQAPNAPGADGVPTKGSPEEPEVPTTDVDESSSWPFVEDWVVPIPDACRLGPDSFLATCLAFALGCENAAIFDKPVVQAVMDFKWERYGRGLFTGLLACSLLLAMNFSAFTLTAEDLGLVNKIAWSCVLLLNVTPLVGQEALQVLSAVRAGSLVEAWRTSPGRGGTGVT